MTAAASNDQSAHDVASKAGTTVLEDNAGAVQQQQQQQRGSKELHIAPMLNYSTREFSQLMRILSKHLTLWTEMVVDETVAHSPNLDEHLAYDESQHPIVCQIGGNSPELCGEATSIVMERCGYDEINLNIDCPSERVSGKREFGACLMKKAELAKQIIAEMQANAPLSESRVSVKCRIGVDEWDDLEFAADFIRTLQPVCSRFYLHARKCVLGGLMNARQNRSVPPLNYPRVYALCDMFPDCQFWINGGIRTLEEAKLIAHGWNFGCGSISSDNNENGAQYQKEEQNSNHQVPCAICNLPYGSCTQPPVIAPFNLKGCMMGRAAMDDPCLFNNADKYFFDEEKIHAQPGGRFWPNIVSGWRRHIQEGAVIVTKGSHLNIPRQKLPMSKIIAQYVPRFMAQNRSIQNSHLLVQMRTMWRMSEAKMARTRRRQKAKRKGTRRGPKCHRR